MRTDDLPAAFRLSAQAGWNQTQEDWAMLLDLNPQGCLAMEVDGKLASTTTLLCYGRRLAWIGMVLTDPAFRRRGLAYTLFQECLNRADNMSIETVKLDATDQGRPLYEKFGFRDEQQIERWSRPGNSATFGAPPATLGSSWSDDDSRQFGTDRRVLLAKLASRSSVYATEGAYLLARPGRLSAYLGPCISTNAAAARTLITHVITHSSCSWLWDLFPRNHNATKLASDLGFFPQRRLTRMCRGKDLPVNSDGIYAIAGFELG
jgi:GNAT superfamily N-acetyltransferase